LRTADGAEIYVDGELLEMNFDDDALHEKHMVRKHVEIDCENDEECDKNVVILSGDHDDLPEWITEEGDNVFIHKEIHEKHNSADAHKVIVIRKEIITED
jgi:hypothetical protein